MREYSPNFLRGNKCAPNSRFFVYNTTNDEGQNAEN